MSRTVSPALIRDTANRKTPKRSPPRGGLSVKFKVVTIYSNIDEQFLTNFVSKAPPDLIPAMAEMMNTGKSGFSSKDPDSDQCATTTWEIIEEKP